MSGLSDLFSSLFSELDGLEIPALPASNIPCGNDQAVDLLDTSRISRNSRAKTRDPETGANFEGLKIEGSENFAREGISQKDAGIAGNAGKVEIAPAETDTYLFPQKLEKVGSAGRDFGLPAAPSPVVLIDPSQVRAGVEREIRDLAAHGRTGPEAVRDAIAITRAKIRNSPLLVESQTGASHCLVCDDREDQERPFIPVLTGVPGRLHWMHIGCHAEHSRRLAAKVAAIMSTAGFGDAEIERGAA